MANGRKECVFDGRLVMLGFGSVGQGVLPLLRRHIDMPPQRMVAIHPGHQETETTQTQGVRHLSATLTRENFREVLAPHLGRGDFLLNVSVDVSSTSLIRLCQDVGALYLDTCIEPWAGGYVDVQVPPTARSNYALREEALSLRRRGGPTAIVTHGANPGLVSHFVKQALLDLAERTGAGDAAPTSREQWAQLAQRLGVRVIHIAERDTQVSHHRKQPGEFVNTWSVDGFIGEGLQPAELGWGTHERHFPPDGGRHEHGSRAAIYLNRPGAGTRVRTWTPLAGPIHGFLITHSESISIADYLTVGEPARPIYRPTVHYAYHPCDEAVLSLHELAGRAWRPQQRKRILGHDILDGRDELGVLLMGHKCGAYWYGSQLSIEEARALAPHNSATTLQVAAAVLAGVVWAMQHPQRSLLEPDDLPYEELMPMIRPDLGPVAGTYTDWTPLADRGYPFDEDIDAGDPWQFKNFRVD